MMTRIYLTLLVLLFASFGLSAQDRTITFGEVEGVPGTVSVPVTMENFTNLDGFQIAYTYDPNILTPVKSLDDRFLTGGNIIWDHQVGDGEAVVFFMDFNMNSHDLDGVAFTLKFEYTGAFDSELAFNLNNTEIMVNNQVVNNNLITFVNGAVTADPELISGTITLGNVDDVVIGSVVDVPVYLEGEGFGQIAALDLQLGFNPMQLLYEGVAVMDGVDIEFTVNEDDGQIMLAWAGTALDFTEATHIANIRFTYNGVDDAEVEILPGSEISSFAGALPYAAVNGLITPKDLDSKVTIAHVDQYSGNNVEVPVTLSGITADFPLASNISLRIAYDQDMMSFEGYTSDYSSAWTVGTTTPGLVVLTLVDFGDGIELDNNTLINLSFNVDEVGTSAVEFVNGTNITTQSGAFIPFSFVSGAVSVAVPGSVYDALVDARENTTLVLAEEGVNHISASITYPNAFIVEDQLGFDVLTNDWKVDAYITSSETVPAGTEMHLSFNEGTPFVVVLEDALVAGEGVFLSELILMADADAQVRTALLDHAGLVDVLDITFRSDVTFETTLTVASIVSNDGFILSEDGTTPGFVLASDELAFTVYGEPALLFAFNGVDVYTGFELEFCHNEDVTVTLSAIVEGQAPFTIEYTLNGDAQDAIVVEEMGDVMFGPAALPVGTHQIVITSIEDALGLTAANPEDVYFGTIVVRPEPVVAFEFNGVLAETGSEFTYEFGEEVIVTLAEVIVGDAPFTIEFTVNDVVHDAVVASAADVIYEADDLEPGTYEIVVTSIVDANGCAVDNPEDAYYATVIVEQIVEVATLAALRDMEADGTTYLYTGDAVIVAMDGFRNRKFIQDETAAILIDDAPDIITTEYDLYDVITNVRGKLNVFRNMVQFQPDSNTAPAEDNVVVEPTVFALDAVTADDQAKLIRFERVEFVGIEEGDEFSNGTNYTITDGTNDFVLRTDFWNVDFIDEEIPHGPLNIAGVVISYNETLQIVPRFAADIEEAEILYEVTFNVDLGPAIEFENLLGFDPDQHNIFITGSLVGWAAPGELPEQTMTKIGDDPYVYSATFQLPAGEYQYKYFSDLLGDGWEGGEWPGDPNRVIVVEDDMVVNNIFAYGDDEVTVQPTPEPISFNMYPNPARDRFTVEANTEIIEVRMIDMLGQVVYTAKVGGQRHTMSVHEYKNGVYFVQILTSDGLITERLQVTK